MYLTRVSASLLACTALAAPILAQGKPFKHALPANTLAYFSLPDLNTSATEFQSTALAKMWREEEVQDFVADAMKLGQAKWAEGLEMLRQMNQAGQFPVPPDDILKLRVSSLSGAITQMKIQMGENNRPQPHFGMLMHVDFGASAQTWQKVIGIGMQMMEMQLQQVGAEKKMTKLEAGPTITTFSPPPQAGTKMGLNVAFVGNGLVIGTLTDDVTNCVNAMLGGKSILTESPLYKATTKHVSPDGAEVEGYVHIEGFIDFAMGFMRLAEQEAPGWPQGLSVDGLERAIDALGLRGIKAVAVASRYEGSKSVTRGFVHSPAAERKGLVAQTSGPLDMGFLKWVPKDVESVSAGRLDMASIYDGLVGALKAYNPEMAKGMMAQLKEQEEAAGISIRNDFFAAFGSQMVSWSMGVQNFMAAPELAMLMEVKDQQKLLQTLSTIAKMSNGLFDFPSSERKGIKTWRLEIDPEVAGPQAAQVLAMMQPSFAFKDGYMVLALATGDVRKAMKRMERGADAEAKGDIRSNKEFKAYFGQMEKLNVASFGWTDWRVTFENVYNALTSVLAITGGADELPLDMTLLPEAETLSQHLHSSMTWATSSDDGFHSTTLSPIGPEVLVAALAVGAGAGAAMFGMSTRAPAPVFVDPANEAEADPPAKKKKADEKKKGGDAKKKGEAKEAGHEIK